MDKYVLFAAVAATLFAAPVHAIKINDHALTANGGSMDNIQGTAPSVFDTLRTASNASQFDAVGRIGDCTGSWLGTEGEYAWVLTAARCVANTNLVHAADHLTFTNKNGIALAGGAGSTSYIHPKRINRPISVRDAGTDIALVRMKRLPASDTGAPAAPMLYDGKAEAGAIVSFVAYGSAFASNVNVNAVWPTEGERRAWGESRLDGVNENGHALFANYTTGHTVRWAGLTTSDAGSAWWQERNGQWQIVATTSGGSTVQSHGARVSTYATWINDLFPNAKLSSALIDESQSAEITQSRNFQVTAPAGNVGFIKAPDQPNVDAPTTTFWANYQNATTFLRVPVTNAKTGEVRLIKLRGNRWNCGTMAAMNNRAGCPSTGTLHVKYEKDDNPFLGSGTWRGRLLVDAHDGSSRGARHAIDIDVAVVRSVTATMPLVTANVGRGIASSIPSQENATGPTNIHSVATTTGVSAITVNARDAVTQNIVPIKLRATRNNGCADVAMNNAAICPEGQTSTLKLWFDPSDNPTLAPSRYRTQIAIQGRSWGMFNTFNETAKADVDINLMP